MIRRSWLPACALLLATRAAVGQAPSQAPRPEALLPEGTLFYVGTDDADAMLAKSRSSPMGRILAEQEVKDFLVKPVAELRAAIDMGLAAARQNPALSELNLDVDKVLAGPYGRAFVACTHLDLPPANAFDPAAIDIGIVVGLEPRAGAVDPFALIKQIIVSIAQSEGRDEGIKIETLQGDGFTYDRIRAPGGAPPLCFANLDGLSLLTLSERTLNEVAKRARKPGASLHGDPTFMRATAAAGVPATGDVVIFLQVGRMMELLHQGISVGLTMQGKGEATAIVDKIFEVAKLSAFGPMYATSTWRDGVAVSVAYSEVDHSAGGLAGLVNPMPIDRDALRFIPKNALSFSLSSISLAPLWDVVMDGLKQAAPEIHQMVAAQIGAFETKAAGADEQGNPNWNIRRDLIGAISGRVTMLSMPGSGSMLGPGGDMIFSLETPNPEGLERSLKHVFTLAGDVLGNPIRFKESLHGDAKLQVLDPMSLGSAAMVAGSMQITYTIYDGKFWIATTTKSLKKALDARMTPPAESITSKPDFAARYVDAPKDAVVTGLSYSDTAVNFENSYQQLLGVFNTVMMMQGGMDDLPIDMALLPTAEAISKHLFGTVAISYRVGENGHVTISRGPFGAEAGLAIGAGAVMVGALVGIRAEKESIHRKVAEAVEQKEAAARATSTDPAMQLERAERDLADIDLGITIYVVNNNRLPASIDELVLPLPDYPKGILERDALPSDPWGHAYSYKALKGEERLVWSFGPNGIDEQGGGDDIAAKKN